MMSTEEIVEFQENSHLNVLFDQSESEVIRVVYFWQNYCPCDATVLGHFMEMEEKYTQQGVDFLVADLSLKPKGESMSQFKKLEQERVDQFRHTIPFTPAVAVWDEDNQLSYYGPHNLGFVCNAKTSFVQKILDGLLAGNASQNVQTLGDGCFCANQNLISG